MKKWKKLALTIIPATMVFTMTSFAGQWKQDHIGWWYQKDDGSWYQNGWQWIDGNQDGLAECYYFEESGYITLNGKTADGYDVNGDGAWIENGAVQRKAMGTVNGNEEAAVAAYLRALEKNNTLDAMDVDSSYEMAMEVEGITMTVGMNQNLQMSGVRSGDMKYVASGTMTMFGAEFPTTVFYTDGYYYMDMLGMKVKQPMNLDEALESAKSNMSGVEVDMALMRNMKLTQNGENYVISYDTDNAFLNHLMAETMGVEENADSVSSYIIHDYNGSITLSKDGYIKEQKLYMDMDVTSTASNGESTTSNSKIDMVMTYHNPGQPVTVAIPSTAGYSDITESV